MRIVVGSVIYSEAIPYIHDFLKSLQQQTVQNFDVLLINDNIPMDIITQLLELYSEDFKGRIKIEDCTSEEQELYELRIQLLSKVKKEGYNLLVLADCDDMSAENRIEQICNSYCKETAFFYHDLKRIGGDENVIFDLPEKTDCVDSILEKNYLGLSNTAINMECITKKFIETLQEGNTKVFDWYLFSRILLNGGVGKKVINTYTFYRIHETNLAGICGDNLTYLKKERDIKAIHYQLLEKYDKRFQLLLKRYIEMDVEKAVVNTNNNFWWGRLGEM